MRPLSLLLIALLWLAPHSVRAQAPLSSADKQAIQQVIQGQIAAFQRDDAAAAFGFASPDIQTMFGTPEHFIDMVQSGYAPVYRPRAMKFSEIVGDVDHPVQLLDVVGPDGATVTAAYEMIQMPDGSWRINGCVLLAPQRREVRRAGAAIA